MRHRRKNAVLETTSLPVLLSCFLGSLKTLVTRVINPLVFLIEHLWNTQISTCIRLFPQSATIIFPLESTATPVGALNCPLPSPFDPNFSMNSPSWLNTCMGLNKKRKKHDITSNITNLLLPVHLLTKLGIEEFQAIFPASITHSLSLSLPILSQHGHL